MLSNISKFRFMLYIFFSIATTFMKHHLSLHSSFRFSGDSGKFIGRNIKSCIIKQQVNQFYCKYKNMFKFHKWTTRTTLEKEREKEKGKYVWLNSLMSIHPSILELFMSKLWILRLLSTTALPFRGWNTTQVATPMATVICILPPE